MQNSKFRSRVLLFESKKLLKLKGVKFDRGKKISAQYFANILNLLLPAIIDIVLFANRLFLASM